MAGNTLENAGGSVTKTERFILRWWMITLTAGAIALFSLWLGDSSRQQMEATKLEGRVFQIEGILVRFASD